MFTTRRIAVQSLLLGFVVTAVSACAAAPGDRDGEGESAVGDVSASNPRSVPERDSTVTDFQDPLPNSQGKLSGSLDSDSLITANDAGWEPLPGATGLSAGLRSRLQQALQAKGPGYSPRTEIRRPSGAPRFINRLILEDSPYLLQHAHNPVNWYSWGPEAFDAARLENKLVFLSIGYSTCHWCHVMEVESFDNVEMARLMNERFISIKVDREQRPDIDEVYMTAVTLISGHGGWPMSSFLTPDAKPVFGGTYYPPDRFRGLLLYMSGAWAQNRTDLEAQADKIARAIQRVTAARGEAGEVGRQAIDRAVSQLLERHDPYDGGFGGAPKFPHESELLLLLQTALRNGNARAVKAVTKTLDAMARGGIYDQVGGGFARYSTDGHWLVPHFEKMLYNQAQLARVYLEAHRLTGAPFYERVARQTLDYVLRDMTSPEGGFYSATDADSEGEEGLFFLWTPEQLEKVLTPDEAKLAMELYAVTRDGNFEGKSILHLPLSFRQFAKKIETPLPDLLRRVDAIREKLYQAREKRVHPLRDEKILTSWNGMMIATFAMAYEQLGEERYLATARRAAEFLWRENRPEPGKLWRVRLDGSSSVAALQEDYAYLADALLLLHDVTGESLWLRRSRQLADTMLTQFWDGELGGFFMSAVHGDPLLIARPKSPNDGAMPSGNGVGLRLLARLFARTGVATYRIRTEEGLAAFSAAIEKRPSAHSTMLMAADDLLHGEAGPRQYGASGHLLALGNLAITEPRSGQLTIDIRMDEGWHINAHEPLESALIPTTLSIGKNQHGWELRRITYPEAKNVRLSFSTGPLAIYEKRARITAQVAWTDAEEKNPAPVLRLVLGLQACDEKACLKPEKMVLEVPMAFARGMSDSLSQED